MDFNLASPNLFCFTLRAWILGGIFGLFPFRIWLKFSGIFEVIAKIILQRVEGNLLQPRDQSSVYLVTLDKIVIGSVLTLWPPVEWIGSIRGLEW